MDATILRRVLNGLGANAYGQFVTVVVQLVGVPVLLYAWGSQLYGEWLILFAIPAFLVMSDLGFSQSAGNDMTARVGRGDRAGALTVFQSLLVLVCPITVAGLILSVGAIWHLPLRDWLRFEAMDAETVRWALSLLVAQMFVYLLNAVTYAGFRCTGDYALQVSLESTTRLLQFVGVWIVALAGGGPAAAAVAFFGVRALATPALAVLLVRRHQWLRFGIAHARRAELHRLFRPALANVAIPLAQALNIQGMVLVISAALGPLAVVVFTTLRTLTRLVLQLVLAVSHAAEPELAAAYGAGNRALMRSLFVHMLRGGLWLAVVAATGLALFGGFILDVWTHGKVAMDSVLFSLLLGSALASVLWYGALIMLRAANLHLRAASIYAVASGMAVGMAAVLLAWSGNVADTGVALLIMDTVMALYTLNVAARLLNRRPIASLLEAANPYPLLNLTRGKAHVR